MSAPAVGELLTALAVIITLARTHGALARRCGQPAVVREILAGMVLGPLGLAGVVLGLWLIGQQAVVHRLPFTLFLGVATAITAFPVLARILAERGMQRTRVGRPLDRFVGLLRTIVRAGPDYTPSGVGPARCGRPRSRGR
jgi:Kef-type K+ transport system membrane component KefB